MNDKQQRILDTALALFRAHGYRMVGIDRILAESGVAKMTLYKYFPAKDALIRAVLEARDQDFCQSLAAFVATFPAPEEKLGAVFLWHEQWFRSDAFNGCMFINAAAEFPDPGHPARQIVSGHKRRIQGMLADVLAARLDDEESAAHLAAQLSLLLDGAIIAAQTTANSDAARLAWHAATTLLHAAGILSSQNLPTA
ncbi:MAG: TetR/AcrR family transcriptional regulator [Zoogloeaceae bacterium]|jgi:AcrR family transcriptional regulator|nr:TetR/AcrR family transcriptional regulator [Zoogloeaceae bacterium]